MPTLYCPTCGYNLTGLPENRCPECGKAFDPQDLQYRLEGRHPDSPKPITLLETLLRLLLLPGIFLLTEYLAIATDGTLIPLTIFSGLALLIGGFLISRNLARRLAVSGGCDEGDRRRVRGPYFIPTCTAGLYCCQIAVGIGPCAAIAWFVG